MNVFDDDMNVLYCSYGSMLAVTGKTKLLGNRVEGYRVKMHVSQWGLR
jgi:hypothetical protein